MKSNKTSSKSPAPATKSAAAAKKAVAAPTAVRTASAVAKARTSTSEAVAEKKAAPAPAVVTVISARIDVGFGNGLYVRGDGPGLNWLEGALMLNVGSDLWTITLEGASAPIRFKFLVNDQAWAAGEDCVAEPGAEIILVPAFD